MRILPLENLSPEENMRRDEEALLSLENSEGEPILRLYKWDRLCLSLGYFQNEEKSLKLPTVRRPTGGGALLHGWDVSFALIDYRDKWGWKPSRIYAEMAKVFMETFRELGIEVKLERFKGRYLDRFYCFWVPTLGELTYRGRKIVSMAMRTLKNSFLIHGSVYIEFDYKLASEFLNTSQQLLKDRIVSLAELGISEGEFLKTFLSSFCSLYSQEFLETLDRI